MAFESAQKIRFDDVDGAGIVYYPQYFHLCHKAFEDFFDDVATLSYPQLIKEMRRGFPAVAIESQFVSPLTYGDTAVVRVAVDKVGTSSTTFHYRIHRSHDSQLCFEAHITKVFMDLDTRKSEKLPDELRSMLEGMLSVTN
ncbi:MAG: acyl-CoA thioesterase [Gammaproteobacteria bacterium]|nr:acyl-CoA thioesterase [Gammaproteobacteria bacterium]